MQQCSAGKRCCNSESSLAAEFAAATTQSSVLHCAAAVYPLPWASLFLVLERGSSARASAFSGVDLRACSSLQCSPQGGSQGVSQRGGGVGMQFRRL